PSSARYVPDTTLIKVDLPAPLSPTTHTTSCGKTSKSTSLRACTAPKRLLIPFSARTGVSEGLEQTVAVASIEKTGCADLVDGPEAIVHDRGGDVVARYGHGCQEQRGNVDSRVVEKRAAGHPWRGRLRLRQQRIGDVGGHLGLGANDLV